MTDVELKELTERHFKKTKRKTFYRIQFDGGHIAVGRETCREMWPGQAIIIRKDFTEMDIESSLSIEDMQALAVAKIDDEDFWIKSVRREDQKEICYDD